METVFDLPVIALRNIPESVVSKLHHVTSTATGYAAVAPPASTTANNNTKNDDQFFCNKEQQQQGGSSSQQPPLAVLDGTKIVSRIHLGSAIRKTLMNVLGGNNKQQNQEQNTNNTTRNAALTATQLIEQASRAVSPRRLASPTRDRSSNNEKESNTNNNNSTADKNDQKQTANKQRIANQLVFALNTSKTNAVKNFALPTTTTTTSTHSNNTNKTEDAAAPTTPTPSTPLAPTFIHPVVIIVFDVEISPAEAWRWVRASGASPYVISLDNLQTTVDAEAVCKIYSLDPKSELSSSLSMSSSLGGGGSKASNSNFPNKIPTRDISWLERQVVSKIATTGV